MLDCENLVKVRLKTLMTILSSLKLSCLNSYCVTASLVPWSGCAARTCNFPVPFFRKRKLLKNPSLLHCTPQTYMAYMGVPNPTPPPPPPPPRTHTHTQGFRYTRRNSLGVGDCASDGEKTSIPSA